MSMISKHLSKLADLFRARGATDALLEGAARTLHAASLGRCSLRRLYLFSQIVERLPAPHPRRGKAITVRRIECSDPVVSRLPRPTAELAHRFAAGAECLLAEVDGEPAGFLWFQSGAYDDPDIGVRFAPEPGGAAVWDFDVYVAPAHRGGLVFFKLWAHAGELLRSRAVRYSVSFVWANNDDSIRAHQRLGAFPVASAWQIRWGRRTLHIADRAPRLRWLRPGAPPPLYSVDARPASRRTFVRFPEARGGAQMSTSAGAG